MSEPRDSILSVTWLRHIACSVPCDERKEGSYECGLGTLAGGKEIIIVFGKELVVEQKSEEGVNECTKSTDELELPGTFFTTFLPLGG